MLLIVSVCVNVFFLAFYVPSDQNRISGLIGQINTLASENTQLQLEAGRVSPEEFSPGIIGYASLQAPAVSQTVQVVNRGRYSAQALVQKGSIMNISVEIAPGKGRVLVQTKPLMGVVFQGAANTAVAVARNKTGTDLSKSDVIFSIDSGDIISEVDGPSAGALMTLLTISALEKQPIDQSLTLTGTIDINGHIGAIGGIVAKATAVKENGKTLFLIPQENQLITPPVTITSNTGIFSVPQQPQQQVSARDYIEKNIGINVTYVTTIDDVIAIALEPSA
ncbi:MAG: S16 family serine protease [Methanoregula sp.]